MALRPHMKVEGSVQGLITKECSRRGGREDTAELVAFEQHVLVPKTKETGSVTGHARFDPVVITKEIDRSSPLLQRALVTNEMVTVVLTYYRYKDGLEQHYYTIELTEATVVEYTAQVKFTLDEQTEQYPPLEMVGFAFGKIKVTWEEHGIMYTYSLNEPQS